MLELVRGIMVLSMNLQIEKLQKVRISNLVWRCVHLRLGKPIRILEGTLRAPYLLFNKDPVARVFLVAWTPC
jgi:hypothetical protein